MPPTRTYPPTEWRVAIPEPPRMETTELTDSTVGYTWTPTVENRRDRWCTTRPEWQGMPEHQIEVSWERLLFNYGPVRDTTPSKEVNRNG
jgi:hypothetical protein